MGIPDALTAKSVGCSMMESIRPYSTASCADMKKSLSVSSMTYKVNDINVKVWNTEIMSTHRFKRFVCEFGEVTI